jgi:hypothetical protein
MSSTISREGKNPGGIITDLSTASLSEATQWRKRSAVALEGQKTTERPSDEEGARRYDERSAHFSELISAAEQRIQELTGNS